MIGAFAIIDAFDEFGNDEIDVGIALAVAVAAHVGGHTINEGGEIGAVIEIETAQEILVCLTLTRMLGSDQTGNGLEHLASAQNRPEVEIAIAHDARRPGVGDADKVDGAAIDDDFRVFFRDVFGPRQRRDDHRCAKEGDAADHDRGKKSLHDHPQNAATRSMTQ